MESKSTMPTNMPSKNGNMGYAQVDPYAGGGNMGSGGMNQGYMNQQNYINVWRRWEEEDNCEQRNEEEEEHKKIYYWICLRAQFLFIDSLI